MQYFPLSLFEKEKKKTNVQKCQCSIRPMQLKLISEVMRCFTKLAYYLYKYIHMICTSLFSIKQLWLNGTDVMCQSSTHGYYIHILHAYLLLLSLILKMFANKVNTNLNVSQYIVQLICLSFQVMIVTWKEKLYNQQQLVYSYHIPSWWNMK